MFYINDTHPKGICQVWYKKVNIIDEIILLNYLHTLQYMGGDYNGRDISREQRWYHKEGRYFHPKWEIFNRWQSYNYDSVLNFMEPKVNRIVNKILYRSADITNEKQDWMSNSILINKYETGDNIIPKHRDSEHIFGDNPTIAIYSVGAPRKILFRRVCTDSNKSLKEHEPIDITLESGSLLIMSGAVQKYYTHEIMREPHIKDVRYSLTFRDHKL